MRIVGEAYLSQSPSSRSSFRSTSAWSRPRFFLLGPSFSPLSTFDVDDDGVFCFSSSVAVRSRAFSIAPPSPFAFPANTRPSTKAGYRPRSNVGVSVDR